MLAELAVALALGTPPSPAAGPAASASPPEEGRRDGARPAGETPAFRGRAIYHRGEGVSEIVAVVGDARLAASAVPCAGCHGPDGRGKAEGGVTPPDLRHAALTRPYAAPYDDRLLRRAITRGISSSGKELSSVMPRYQMTRADLDALVAFLNTLGDEAVPGVGDHSIRAGVFLPPDRRAASIRAAVGEWAGAFNARGGVYGRLLEVRFATAPPRAADRASALTKFIRDEDLFALFASSTDGAASAAGFVPILSAFDDHPDIRAPSVRYLLAGIPQQRRALESFAAESGTGALTLTIASLAGASAFEGPGPRAVAFPTLPVKHPEQTTAKASAEIFAAGLRGAGVDLTRERLLQAVDDLYGFDTGVGPVTYRGNRRIGAGGAWIVVVQPDGSVGEPRFVRVSD
ncbi:MAG: c-type cytochrome [Acidobacteriota bacterium]